MTLCWFMFFLSLSSASWCFLLDWQVLQPREYALYFRTNFFLYYFIYTDSIFFQDIKPKSPIASMLRHSSTQSRLIQGKAEMEVKVSYKLGLKKYALKKNYEFLEGHSDSHLVKLLCFLKIGVFFFFSPFYFELKRFDAFCR